MKIEFHYEADFKPIEEDHFSDWINRILINEKATASQLDYIFCNDDYLCKINLEYLGHDTLTDIITFDYTDGPNVSGDIFISIERVKENANKFNTLFENELLRVMSHGVLHLLGYNDKSESEKELMRKKEDEMIKLFHVEH